MKRGGAAAVVYCDPRGYARESAGYFSYEFNVYDSPNDHDMPFLTAWESLALCNTIPAAVNNPTNRTNTSFTWPRVNLYPDVNDWVTPDEYFFSGRYFGVVRVFFPLWGLTLAFVALYRLIRFIQQQHGPKLTSLAQWSMLFEFIANVFRAVYFIGSKVAINVETAYAMRQSEGLIMANMVLSAVFWGTLDVNSSPLHRFRYVCGVICSAFLITTAVLGYRASQEPSVWAPIFTHWFVNCQCAIGCVIFLFVPRRLYQLSKYSLTQTEPETATKNAEAGDAALKEHEENADEDDTTASTTQSTAEASAVSVSAPQAAASSGKSRPPVVLKMFYWTILVGITCLVAIIQLILEELYESEPQPIRYNKRYVFYNLATFGFCGFIMSTCQILMFSPKKKRGQGQGSTVGSMNASVGTKTSNV
jgi:hypothetical protein